MLRVALRPRFLGLLAAMIAATIVCGLLAGWQWDRAHRSLQAQSAGTAQTVPLEQALAVGSPVTNRNDGRAVTATGTFDADEQVLVPGRRIDGSDAVIVVTALHVPQAGGGEARLPVARGWVAASDVTDASGTLDVDLAPEPPSGTVTVTGRLEASESASSAIEDGVAQEIATPLLVNVWGSPMYSGFVAATSPMSGLEPMPEATSAFSRGLNLQNLGYAAQWIAFGLFFLYLWWRSVRTQYEDEEAERAEQVRSRLEPRAGHTGDDRVQDPLRPDRAGSADADPDDADSANDDDGSAARGSEEVSGGDQTADR